MRRLWTGVALILASVLCWGAPSRALADDVHDCITPGDGLIDGCTRVIQSRKFSGKGLAWAYNNRGIAWSQKGDYDKAIADFNEAVKLDPNNVPTYANRGSALSRKGEFDKAISDFSAAIKLNPANALSYSDRGFMWVAKGEYEKAITDLDEAIRLDPKQARAYATRGNAWNFLREYDKGIADYSEAIRLAPTEKDYVSRAYAWSRKGELDKSIADCTTAMGLDPKDLFPYLIRGDNYRFQGKLDLALKDFDQALVVFPNNIPTLARRGLTYEKMQQIDRAREEYQKALHAPLPQIDILNQALRAAQVEEAIQTARARLAALDSGVAPPTIPSPPASAIKRTAIPTPEVQPAKPAVIKPAAGRRVALVIGNSAYRNVPSLANPEKDARAIADTLRNIGFAVVTLQLNATREKMIDALRDFAKETANSDWAMIYYAGHGIEVGGVNYLIPVDARIAVDRDIQNEAVALSQLLNAAEAARKIKLIMLDACRDNPFKPQRTPASDAVPASTAGGSIKSRSTSGHGLAEVRVTGATLVVYAAKDGQVAMDGEGGNSPFAVAVVQRIATPGVEINKVFRLVRDDVMEATAARQEPYTYGSLPGKEDFFFVEKP